MLVKLLKGSLIACLIIGYPAIIYYLLANDLPLFGATFVLAMVFWKLKNRDDWLIWVTGILLIAALVGYLFGPGFISKLSPLMIHLSLFVLFGHSLQSTPLIERFARLDFPQLPPGIAAYCRKLTAVWTGFFGLNILGCFWLAIAGDDKLWALYNGLIVYLLIGLLMVGEYFWRKFRFPELEIPTFRQSVENMIKNGHQVWAPDNERKTPAK